MENALLHVCKKHFFDVAKLWGSSAGVGAMSPTEDMKHAACYISAKALSEAWVSIHCRLQGTAQSALLEDASELLAALALCDGALAVMTFSGSLGRDGSSRPLYGTSSCALRRVPVDAFGAVASAMSVLLLEMYLRADPPMNLDSLRNRAKQLAWSEGCGVHPYATGVVSLSVERTSLWLSNEHARLFGGNTTPDELPQGAPPSGVYDAYMELSEEQLFCGKLRTQMSWFTSLDSEEHPADPRSLGARLRPFSRLNTIITARRLCEVIIWSDTSVVEESLEYIDEARSVGGLDADVARFDAWVLRYEGEAFVRKFTVQRVRSVSPISRIET